MTTEKIINKKKVKERDSNYISPKEFTTHLKSYYDLTDECERRGLNFNMSRDEMRPLSSEDKKLVRDSKNAYDICGLQLYKMVKGLSNNGRFSGYTWKEEMISDALLKLVKALDGKKYDFSKNFNPFSYFNTIGWREFIARIKIENKKNKTMDDYRKFKFDDICSDQEDNMQIYTKQGFDDYEHFIEQ